MKRLPLGNCLFAVVSAAAILVGGTSWADLIVWEPFLSGGDPAAGEYAPDQGLAPAGGTPQDPAVPGFTGPWQGNTGLITSQAYVLPDSPPDAAGGSVRFQWPDAVGERQIYRELGSYTSGQPVYYISGLIELDPGFSTAANAQAMNKLLGIDASGTYGMRWGFDSDGSEADAAVQFRMTDGSAPLTVIDNGISPGTHRFVMRIQQNQRGDIDRTAVWLDPDPAIGEADLSARKLLTESDNWNDAVKPVDRLYIQGLDVGLNVPAYYDEIRFGTTWNDVVPQSAAYPNRLLLDEAFSGAAGTQPPGWQAFTGSALLLSENDGNGEYQQKKVTSPAGSPYIIASYADENDIAQGTWRDVTLTAKTRFSGGGSNENGVIFRAGDITSETGSGDFYHARVSGSTLQLYRFVNGSAELLAEEPLSGFNPFSYSNWYRISAENIPSLGTDDVHIVAELFNDAAMTNLAGRIEFVDTADNAITRPGGVGFRSYTTAGSNTRSVFDDLTVVSDNPALLWYDDYFDGDAPHMTAYGNKSQVISTADKYQFQGGSTEGIGFVDLPDVTSQPEWADVAISAVMRMSDDGGHAGGLISRVTGVEDPGAGNNTSTGDFYMYRLQRSGTDRAQLYRRNDGSFTLLDEVDLGFDIPVDPNEDNWDIFLRMLTFDVGDEVQISAQASLDPDFNDIFGEISFRDASPDRILGPGAAGFRVYGGGTINFDNFTVSAFAPTSAAIPEPSSLVLMGLATIGLAAFARRRKQVR